MHDPLVLDTSVFRHKDFLQWLIDYRGRKILPAVGYCELCYHMIANRNKQIKDVDRLLRRSDIEVQDFSRILGSNVALNCKEMEEKDFREHWRDYMIASHASIAPVKLITDNVRHFQFLGDRVFEPHDFMRQV